MLLMISSHTMNDTVDFLEQSNLTKLGRMQMNNNGVGDGTLTINEIAVYRDKVREACRLEDAKIKAHFAGEDECIGLGMLEKECAKRTDWLDKHAIEA